MSEIISRSEAIRLGLKRYFTGKPCPQNHVADRYVDKSTCVLCSFERARRWAKNNPDKAKAIAQRTYEKYADDRRKRSRNKYWANPEKAREAGKRYYFENREKLIAINKEWKKNNKDRVRETDRAWRKNNPERVKALGRQNVKRHTKENRARAAKWRIENLERAKEYRRTWGKNNRAKLNVLGHKRRAVEREADGSFTSDDLKRIYRMQGGKCPYCQSSLKHKYEIDHIIPLSKGGSNYANNIQLLCDNISGNACNQSKNAKDPIDFARSLGKLL